MLMNFADNIRSAKNERRHLQVDEGILYMTNDPDCIFDGPLKEQLRNSVFAGSPSAEEMEKIKIFEHCDSEFFEFLKDRKGLLKSEFYKIFIIRLIQKSLFSATLARL